MRSHASGLASSPACEGDSRDARPSPTLASDLGLASLTLRMPCRERTRQRHFSSLPLPAHFQECATLGHAGRARPSQPNPAAGRAWARAVPGADPTVPIHRLGLGPPPGAPAPSQASSTSRDQSARAPSNASGRPTTWAELQPAAPAAWCTAAPPQQCRPTGHKSEIWPEGLVVARINSFATSLVHRFSFESVLDARARLCTPRWMMTRVGAIGMGRRDCAHW